MVPDQLDAKERVTQIRWTAPDEFDLLPVVLLPSAHAGFCQSSLVFGDSLFRSAQLEPDPAWHALLGIIVVLGKFPGLDLQLRDLRVGMQAHANFGEFGKL